MQENIPITENTLFLEDALGENLKLLHETFNELADGEEKKGEARE